MQIRKRTSAARQAHKVASMAVSRRLLGTRKMIDQLASAADSARVGAAKSRMTKTPALCPVDRVVNTPPVVRIKRTANQCLIFFWARCLDLNGPTPCYFLIRETLPSPLIFLL